MKFSEKMQDMINKGRRIPLNLNGAVIYYAGPTPARGRMPVGSCGPTTSSRMDPFTPALIKLGLGGMIGKGARSDDVRKAIKANGCIYFLATGGAGAFLATKVRSAKAILFVELGPEAVYKLDVRDFPLIVGIDSKGNDIYEKAEWKRK